MRNKFSNLGIILNQEEQKNIKGGTKLTQYDEYCYPQDAPTPAGCPCSADSQCAYSGPINTDWTVLEWQNMRGTCTAGKCH